MEDAITYEDAIITAYREHGQTLMRGDTTYRIIAEMMSKHTGSTRGKGGSMHYYNKKHNFYGGNGIVGAQIPVGTGIAFAMKYEGKKNVCVTMYGDGGANQGQLYEAANMAGLWKLPVIYLLENNNYGMGTSVERASYYRPLMGKFRGYPAVKIDGMNIFAVREGMKFCKEYAIENGPMFVEMATYRYQGHSMSDPGISYRTKDEVTNVRTTKDCINYVKKVILDNQVASEEDLKKIDKEIKNRIDEEVEKIRNDPLPPVEEMTKDIYTGEVPPFIRGVEYKDSIHNNSKY
jgi:pyruvate dehydrogenase E1 component alpha subunit